MELHESLVQDVEGVTVSIVDAQGRQEIWRAHYVVGCDGGRSMVRKALGIKYGGEAQLMNVFLAGLFTAVHLRVPDMYKKYRRAPPRLDVHGGQSRRASGDDLAQRRR